MMPREFGAIIGGLYHAALFSLQEKITELVGREGLRDYVFPMVQESMMNVKKLGIEPIKGGNLDEALSEFLQLLEKSFLLAHFERKDEDTYLFVVDDCIMAKRAHTVTQPKGTCPAAMVAAAIIQKHSGREVTIEWSKLTEKGSVTEIKIA
ncbi:MAG: hypothetical protein KIH01_00775 [Candidatus Freyarchaeota archaeon]|nr:hypothetical protein [Candidatus Jordarchaeia archaeon]